MPKIREVSISARSRCLKNVPTWRCREADHLAYVLDHLEELGGQGGSTAPGGYGMNDRAEIRQGPRSRRFSRQAQSQPERNFIAQPTLALSTCPGHPAWRKAVRPPAHVDLRPFRADRTRTAIRIGAGWAHPGGS